MANLTGLQIISVPEFFTIDCDSCLILAAWEDGCFNMDGWHLFTCGYVESETHLVLPFTSFNRLPLSVAFVPLASPRLIAQCSIRFRGGFRLFLSVGVFFSSRRDAFIT